MASPQEPRPARTAVTERLERWLRERGARFRLMEHAPLFQPPGRTLLLKSRRSAASSFTRWDGTPTSTRPLPVGGGEGVAEGAGPYCSGEKDEGSRILFACVRSVSAPPGGGHTPVSLALVRMAARWSRLWYAQM